MNDPPLLEAEHLSKVYSDGQVNALIDVNLAIERGDYVAVMGPSGCGKSTLLNLLGALDLPTSGRLLFEGQDLAHLGSLDRFRSEKLGFVFQSFFLLPTLTAVENVQLPMFESELGARQRAARASELLASVGLSHRANHLPIRLSGGERQRVAIARALANRPVLLLADEPTGNLDTTTANEVLDLFDQLHREHKMTIVLVTHGQEVAERAGRLVRMRDGRVAEVVEQGGRAT